MSLIKQIEQIEGLKQRLTVIIPAEDIETSYQSRLRKVTQVVKLPKFRLGKAPSEMVEQRFGKIILQEVASELIKITLKKAVEENHLRIAWMPKIELRKVLRGQPLEYVVNYEVYPKIILNTLEGEKVERLRVRVADKDVNNMLEFLRIQYAEWKEVNREAKFGDRVIIDCKWDLDGKAFNGWGNKEFLLELGSNRMIPGFEEGIKGVKPGETKAIDITFLKEYSSDKELIGKTVTCTIKVHKVLEPELPSLDDKFVENIGIKEGGIEALRTKVKKDMEKEVHRYVENRFKITVLDKLVELNPIEVPEALVNAEIEYLQNMTRRQIASQTGKTNEVKNLELPRESYLKQAKKRVVLGLLLVEVIKQHNVQAENSAQIKVQTEEIAAAYPKTGEVASWYSNNRKMPTEVKSVVLKNQVVAVLLNQLEVEEREVPYEVAVQQASK